MRKTFEYELDENGKIVALKIGGKTAKAGFMRGLRRAQATDFWKLYDYEVTARNPFSGVQVDLNGFEASIYGWLMNWYRQYERGVMPVPVQTYDDMKYLFLELNNDAYFDLID
jgi:hypothetical protein